MGWRRFRFIVVCLAMIAASAALVIAGCGGSDGSSRDARAELEGIIRDQLPAKAKQQGAGPVVVDTVQCTNAGGNKYECISTSA